jgi:hypothetical protein
VRVEPFGIETYGTGTLHHSLSGGRGQEEEDKQKKIKKKDNFETPVLLL